ncbi:hypothetical protein CLI64_22915 [Nostoc sp. CENA543]|uniref:hypothetical protein n=1 Tax=Nostoc sp. CENA543 TaxID=1869241 RepID=UPI000CA3CE49|nr:hypothetical protein [Nostoc sp. CENA543]AUT03029.1 hypothetical protein CLI64_22915 [Nostoc sp. CENA543]
MKFLPKLIFLSFTLFGLQGCLFVTSAPEPNQVIDPSLSSESAPVISVDNCSKDGKSIREQLEQVTQQYASLSIEVIEVVESAKSIYKDPACTSQRAFFAETLKAIMKRQAYKNYEVSRSGAISSNILCITRPHTGGNLPDCEKPYQDNLQRIEDDYNRKLMGIDNFFQ